MRISLLEKREDFYKILEQTLENSDFLFKKRVGIPEKYFVNKYLNFIAQGSTNSKVFQNLKNEYSNSKQWWRKDIQRIYVSLAVSKLFRGFFAHKVIQMPQYGEYLILGGNHRLRLFSKDLKSTWSILKKGERLDYIKNDIEVRTLYELSYAPSILNFGEEWLEEQYFEGKPLNRLNNSDKIIEYEKEIVEKHQEELLLLSKKIISRNEYCNFVRKEVNSIIDNKSIISENTIVENILNTLDKLLNQVTIEQISVSWTHGDLQMANILVNDNQVKVIDWESSAKRYFLYDLFVLLGKVRTENSLRTSITEFIKKSQSLVDKVTKQEVLLCLIEELRFYVSEDFSENFYFCGKKNNELCSQILEYINE